MPSGAAPASSRRGCTRPSGMLIRSTFPGITWSASSSCGTVVVLVLGVLGSRCPAVVLVRSCCCSVRGGALRAGSGPGAGGGPAQRFQDGAGAAVAQGGEAFVGRLAGAVRLFHGVEDLALPGRVGATGLEGQLGADVRGEMAHAAGAAAQDTALERADGGPAQPERGPDQVVEVADVDDALLHQVDGLVVEDLLEAVADEPGDLLLQPYGQLAQQAVDLARPVHRGLGRP